MCIKHHILYTQYFPKFCEQKFKSLFSLFLWSSEQRVKEAVITVPAFFNQAERDAVMYAAELAEIKVLQLMNDIAAGMYIKICLA